MQTPTPPYIKVYVVLSYCLYANSKAVEMHR